MTPKEFTEELNKLMKEGNITSKDVAESLDISTSTVDKYVNGTHSPHPLTYDTFFECINDIVEQRNQTK